jgi:hypothetical protein
LSRTSRRDRSQAKVMRPFPSDRMDGYLIPAKITTEKSQKVMTVRSKTKVASLQNLIIFPSSKGIVNLKIASERKQVDRLH